MTEQRISKVRHLFEELVELDPAARATRISDLAPDGSVGAEVTSLLAAADGAGDFLGVLTGATAALGNRESGDVIAARYTLRTRLGEGATGDVYLAWDGQLERQVALKFFRTSAIADLAGADRFIAEARAAAKLDHAHVATVHDIGEAEDGQLFIAMSYYPGETLRDRIARGALTPAVALRIAAQIARALAAAHAAGIVHCDVKPANVLFDGDGAVKLADFGAAKWIANPAHSAELATAGTVAYMPPEQARREPVDDRTDLWSLGVVLFEMLAARRPFKGSTAEETLRAIMNDEPAPLPNDVHITPATRDLLAALLAKSPDSRPAGAASVGETLEQLAVGDESATNAGALISRTLPIALTSFIGRDREVESATILLQQMRLLTLTGPGGTGKTRLALQLAMKLRERYVDGVWFVPLAEVADADLVASLLAQTLGLRDLGGGMLGARIIAALRTRRVLIVLDNFEHVIGAAAFVSRLLAECGGVTLLITSRIPLGLQGEQELPVPPLATPALSGDDARNSEAVQLFVQRAMAVRPSFTLTDDSLAAVADICRRLDGLPLALELAAARAKLLSPRAMLGRLEHRFDILRATAHDRPSRHSTMYNVIDWSYVLLTDEERDLFNRLAVFVGGVSVEAAAAVSGSGESAARAPSAILEILTSLANKSLLGYEEQPDGEPRFVMLETVREFALERLNSARTYASARSAHSAYYLSLAERGAAQMRGPAQAEWFDRLEKEYANCRIALEDALGRAETGAAEALPEAQRLAIALHRLWMTRGPLLEGVEYLRRTIALADEATSRGEAVDKALGAALLSSAGQLANTRSEFPTARDLFARSLALYRDTGDETGTATNLNNLAWTLWIIGDLNAGETTARAAMAMHASAGNSLGVTLSVNTLAWIEMERGDYASADAHFAEVLSSHRARGDRRATAFTLGWIGLVAARRGDLTRAIELQKGAIDMLEPVADRGYRMLSFVRLAAARHAAGEPGDHAAPLETEYLPSLKEQGRLWPIAYTLTELGEILRDNGALERARTVLLEAIEVRRQTGAMQGMPEARLLLGGVYRLQGDTNAALESLTEALRNARDLGTAPVIADCIDALAMLALDMHDLERAATLFGTVDRLRKVSGWARTPRSAHAYDDAMARLSPAAHENRINRSVSTGAAMTIGDAIKFALESRS